MLVIGIGNSMRRDDGAGPAVVRLLRERKLPGLAAVEHPGDGLALLELWSGHDRVWLVDAARSGASAGVIHQFNATTTPLPRDLLHPSSHLFGVGEAVELARIQGRLPSQLLVFAIEGDNFSFGTGLTPAVMTGVHGVMAIITASMSS